MSCLSIPLQVGHCEYSCGGGAGGGIKLKRKGKSWPAKWKRVRKRERGREKERWTSTIQRRCRAKSVVVRSPETRGEVAHT